MPNTSDTNRTALQTILKTLARQVSERPYADAPAPRRRKPRPAGRHCEWPLVTIDTMSLDVVVLDLPGHAGCPSLTIAWRVGARVPCGVHLGLAASDRLYACVTDKFGVARRALEFDPNAIDPVLLRGYPVTFVLDNAIDSYALADWAIPRGHDVLFRVHVPDVERTVGRFLKELEKSLVDLTSNKAAPVSRFTVADLRECTARALAARAKAAPRS